MDEVQPMRECGEERAAEKSGSTTDAAIIAIASAILCLPFLRSIYWLGDEGIFLRAAVLLNNGKTLYNDIFEFHPPIAFLVPQLWLMLTGQSLAGARVLIVLTVAGISFLTCLICLRISKSRPVSAALTFLWALSSQGFSTQINHHWFATFFSLIAFLNLLPGRNQRTRPFICGFAAGATALTTSGRGSLIVFAAFLTILARGNRTDIWKYIGGGALISALLLLYVIANGSFAAAYQDVIVFAATRYSGIESVPFGHDIGVQNFAVGLMFPVAAVLALLAMLQSRLRGLRDYNFTAALAFGIAGFLGCFPRPSAWHLLYAAPLILPLLSISLVKIPHRRWQTQAATVVFLGLTLASLLGYYRAVKATVKASPIATAAGNVRIVGPNGEPELLKRIAAIGAGQPFLFYPYDPMLSFLTGHEHVARLDLFLPQRTTPAVYAEACVQTVRRAVWVVIDRSWTPAAFHSAFPAMVNPQPPEKIGFERAIESSFALVGTYGKYELRKRQRNDESVCANIPGVGQGEIAPGR
jgi:hypothetical protein